MPKLEDGGFAAPISKFKKRRAWIIADEPVLTPVPTIEAAFVGTKLEQEYNKTITRADLEFDNLFAFIDKQRIQSSDFEDELQFLILNLSDVQKRVFWHIALECISRSSPRTRPMVIKSFFEKLDISIPVIRTTLNRLVDKRLIQREKGRLGKNGFAIISLSKVTFHAVGEIFAGFQSQA